MDKVIQDLIVGAASSGLWSLLANAVSSTVQVLKAQLPTNDVATQSVETAVATVAEHFQLGSGSERAKLLRFLESPEIESIIRQVYANRLAGKETPDVGTDAIRREFLALIGAHLDISGDRILAVADPLFHSLIAACNANLTRTIGHGPLGAHEALSKYRHRRLLDELAAVERNLAMLAAGVIPDIESILAFEEKYRGQVGARHSHIQPPHFDSARKVPIEDLFVAPKFYPPHSRKRRLRSGGTELGIDAVAASVFRLVIVGNPGGGKSTLAVKLVHDMATRYAERPVAGRRLTPVLVILREYGRLKKAQNCSILQFIELQANANYQVQPPAKAFEYLLLNGRVLVVFDGLDELLDTTYRQEVSADVESFCSLYPNVPVIVTSREVGYEQAPLDEEKFSLLAIAPFDEQQVATYSEKWFARDDEDSDEQRRQKAKAFLAESEVTPDLRSNPLMLGLMCNLYKVEGYIPRNRADVYEKCSIMLFERWDRGRGIVVQLPFEAHVRPAMQHLAYWIYSQASLQAGVTQDKLIDQTQEYLITWLFDDAAEARRAAEQFVEYCTGRAWVFTDTGTTAEGQKLYQFTHRTFLEYFASSYLSFIYPTPEALGEALRPHIRREEWDVVATLAFQILNRRVQGAADVLLTALLSGWASPAEQAASVAFAGRCLESIVPSPRVRRAIATAAVDFAVECGAREWSDPAPQKGRRRRSPVVAVLSPLLSANVENRATLAAVFHDRILEKIHASREEGLACLEVALRPSVFEARPYRPLNSEGSQYWRDVFKGVVDSALDRLKDLASSDLSLCITAVIRGLVTIDELLDWHGPAALFRSRTYRCFTATGVPYSSVLIRGLLSGAAGVCSPDELAKLQDDVGRLGRCLLARGTPWIRSAVDFESDRYAYYLEGLPTAIGSSHLKPNDLSSDTLFGAFCLLAMVSELSSHQGRSVHERRLGMLRDSNLILIERIAAARSEPLTPARFAKFVSRCGLSETQIQFIRQWSEGDIKLTDVGGVVQLELPSETQLDIDEIAPEEADAAAHDVTR